MNYDHSNDYSVSKNLDTQRREHEFKMEQQKQAHEYKMQKENHDHEYRLKKLELEYCKLETNNVTHNFENVTEFRKK